MDILNRRDFLLALAEFLTPASLGRFSITCRRLHEISSADFQHLWRRHVLNWSGQIPGLFTLVAAGDWRRFFRVHDLHRNPDSLQIDSDRVLWKMNVNPLILGAEQHMLAHFCIKKVSTSRCRQNGEDANCRVGGRKGKEDALGDGVQVGDAAAATLGSADSQPRREQDHMNEYRSSRQQQLTDPIDNDDDRSLIVNVSFRLELNNHTGAVEFWCKKWQPTNPPFGGFSLRLLNPQRRKHVKPSARMKSIISRDVLFRRLYRKRSQRHGMLHESTSAPCLLSLAYHAVEWRCETDGTPHLTPSDRNSDDGSDTSTDSNLYSPNSEDLTPIVPSVPNLSFVQASNMHQSISCPNLFTKDWKSGHPVSEGSHLSWRQYSQDVTRKSDYELGVASTNGGARSPQTILATGDELTNRLYYFNELDAGRDLMREVWLPNCKEATWGWPEFVKQEEAKRILSVFQRRGYIFILIQWLHIDEVIRECLDDGDCPLNVCSDVPSLQPAYRCYTCGIDGYCRQKLQACCLSCARKCHRGHDVRRTVPRYALISCCCTYRKDAVQQPPTECCHNSGSRQSYESEISASPRTGVNCESPQSVSSSFPYRYEFYNDVDPIREGEWFTAPDHIEELLSSANCPTTEPAGSMAGKCLLRR